jgi:hypothetical protein
VIVVVVDECPEIWNCLDIGGLMLGGLVQQGMKEAGGGGPECGPAKKSPIEGKKMKEKCMLCHPCPFRSFRC